MATIYRYFPRILIYNNYIFIQKNTITKVAKWTNQETIPRRNDKTATVHCIQTLLNINIRTALKIVNENLKLTGTSSSLLSKNFKILEVYDDLDGSTALMYPHLLMVTDLTEAIHKLKGLPLPLNNTIVLAGLSNQMLWKILNSYKHKEDRISILSNLLKISHKETCEFLYKRNFLISRNLKKLESILNVILEFGIPLEDIRKDPWVLRYSLPVMVERIKFITDLKVEVLTPKPWMLRSPIETIENYFKRRQDNRQILGSSSLTEYLSTKLQCTEEQANFLISKMPALQTKSLRTLSDIINFLYDGDDTFEEKSDALQDLLTEIVQNAANLNEIKKDILEKWDLCSKTKELPNKQSVDVDTKLAQLLESRCVATTKAKEYTAEEKKIREAILSQYSQMSDEEEEDVAVQTSGDSKENLEKNTNAQTVVHAERLKREQAKLDSQKKKEKDREDRDKQKQLREDKKEKRKTQKGERRR